MYARHSTRVYLLFLLLTTLGLWQTNHAAMAQQVVQINMHGGIGPASAEYFHAASQQAEHMQADAILLRLDTPGGLSASMRTIIQDILASPIPVITWVGPKGARAASAGTYILYASHIAAMAPATHLGAATPVALGGGHDFSNKDKDKDQTHADDDAKSKKARNDAIAYIQSLAHLRHRNADWARQAVLDAATLTSDQALEKSVVDILADSPRDVLKQLEGKKLNVNGNTITLDLADASIETITPSARLRFLHIISDPSIAYFLLMAGVWGLLLEVFHPGLVFPGTIGAICLLIALYALQMLPINYSGLALMALGIALLVSEFFIMSFGILGLSGIAAFVLGSVMLFDKNIPGFNANLGMIAGIAFSGILLLAIVLWLLLRARKAQEIGGDQQMLDAQGQLLEDTNTEGVSWAMLYGERWQVRSQQSLTKGTEVKVSKRDGLTLWVVPVHPPSKGE